MVLSRAIYLKVTARVVLMMAALTQLLKSRKLACEHYDQIIGCHMGVYGHLRGPLICLKIHIGHVVSYFRTFLAYRGRLLHFTALSALSAAEKVGWPLCGAYDILLDQKGAVRWN